MTFDVRERSADDGKPVRLYAFTHGTTTWRYCSADRALSHGGQVWQSLTGGMRDEGVRQSGDPASDGLTIHAPADLPLVLLFRGLPPSDEVGITLSALHHGDADARVLWVGSVVGINRRGLLAVEIVCESLVASMARRGLSIGYERGCPYTLGDHNCKVVMDDYRADARIVAIDGEGIEATALAAQPNGWWAGGYVEWSRGSGLYERRFIRGHTGVRAVLLGGTAGLALGMDVQVYPGCDGAHATCLGKFNNLDNAGGFPSLPGESPFDGKLVF